jgi:hypothetical protein
MPRFEQPRLFVDVVAARRVGRADHDQSRGRVERRKRLLGQSLAGGEVFAVAEDRAQARGDRASRRLPSGQVLIDLEAFEPTLQPFRPARVGVAVGDEGAIFERERVRHVADLAKSQPGLCRDERRAANYGFAW